MVLLLSGLACSTLLGYPTISSLGQDAGKPTHVPTSTPTPTATPITRLNGDDLPDLEIDPPGNSPSEGTRPELTGDMVTLDTEHFRIHYTLEGDDAVPEEDENGNEQPDYVEEVARALEYSWASEIDHFGWSAPPPDRDKGGDDRYDIYLANIMPYGYAGYTDADRDERPVGDNPNSLQVEENALQSYIALDNDYVEYDEFAEEGIDRVEYMRSVIGHEFAHAIQFGYDGEEPHYWLWEATATWMEDEIFDTVNDVIRIMPALVKSPNACQLAETGQDRDYNDHWYGSWISLRYLSERYGHEAVRQLWEQTVPFDGYAAWDAMLAEKGTIMEDFFSDFSIALLTRGFQEGQDYPTVRLDGRASAGETFTPANGVGQLGADYVEILGNEVLSIRFEGEGLVGVVVTLHDGVSDAYLMENNEVTVDTRETDHAYLIAMNMNRATGSGSCRSLDYTVAVASGGEPSEPVWTLPAPNFEALKTADEEKEEEQDKSE